MQIIHKTYLGIDWGEKRIGLAIGHGEARTAVPLKICADFKEVLMTIKKEEIDKVVIGEPRIAASDKYNVSADFSSFLDRLKSEAGVPVVLVNELLSSKAADALEGGKKNKAGRDALAAMIILQSYFDQQK